MQYQIRDPKGFAKMLDTLIEKGVPVPVSYTHLIQRELLRCVENSKGLL